MIIPYIRLAHEAGLGVGRPEEIRLAGDDVSGETWGFSVGDNMASRVGDLCWFGPLKWAQKLLFHTPLVHLFVFGSECYHDWYRWPILIAVSSRSGYERRRGAPCSASTLCVRLWTEQLDPRPLSPSAARGHHTLPRT
jgi:hypothetical protein